MTEPSPVAYHAAQGVAHIELNRPDAFNALDIPLAVALRDAVADAAVDDEVKVVLLSGRGRAFCAGGDVKMMAAADNVAETVHELATAARSSLGERSYEFLDTDVAALGHRDDLSRANTRAWHELGNIGPAAALPVTGVKAAIQAARRRRRRTGLQMSAVKSGRLTPSNQLREHSRMGYRFR